MQLNFLKEVVESIAGKPATDIVDLLVGKKDVNEFLIAKKLKLTINQTRNILYKLSEAGLVSSTRKKDKRKGWFIYFWTLDSVKSLELLEKKTREELEQLGHQLSNRKSKRFYICKTCNLEVGEETALLNQFICQECGQVYELSESDAIISEIDIKIKKLEKQLETISEEKNELLEKASKKRKRKSSRAAKKKKKAAGKKKSWKKTEKKKIKKKKQKKEKKRAAKKKNRKVKKRK